MEYYKVRNELYNKTVNRYSIETKLTYNDKI